MRIPSIEGLIRRRLLVNFRVDPEVMSRSLPPLFRPKLHRGYAIAGICLIRLEEIRLTGMPACLGISSENAAHRIAVVWDDPLGHQREGVFIPRRDTASTLNHLAGGRVFPGEHHMADIDVQDDGQSIDYRARAHDGSMAVNLRAQASNDWPADSIFTSLQESSDFFEEGCLGYSLTRDRCRLDGIRLQTQGWRVEPLAVETVTSTFFESPEAFPPGSLTFDHALVMRDIPHQWHHEPDLRLNPAPVQD